ncbi:MAG: amidohydrolase [Propionicimonas sp.]|nr:amidohydrolase [Propionicimonas sp.]
MASELVLRNVRLVGGPAGPVDVGLRDGLVAAIGVDLPADTAGELDLDGRWLLPGLADRHVHLLQWAKASRRLDLSAAGSAAEVAGLVRTALSAGVGEVVGFGFRDGLWPDRPTVAALDAAAGRRPVVLVSGDLHCAWLNTAALDRHGVPAAGGLVREQAAFDVMATLDDVDPVTEDGWIRDALQAAAARGVTAVTDLEMRWPFEDWQRRAGAGAPPVRVDAGFYPPDLDRAVGDGLRTGDPVAGTGGRVRVGPLKVITDGSLNTRTAWCVEPYPGLGPGDHPHGVVSVPYADLVGLLRRATAGGLRVAVHAIGDRANQVALDAFEATGAAGSIEHAQLLRREDVARFASLGVLASVQPEHAMDDRDVAERYWPGRTDRAFVLADLHRAGVELRLGSDAPVAPLDPWVTLDAAVTRSRDGREPWHPEQAIDLATALAASTDGVGTVAEGRAADLVVVDRDPAAGGLRTMPVFATMVAGEWTYRAG